MRLSGGIDNMPLNEYDFCSVLSIPTNNWKGEKMNVNGVIFTSHAFDRVIERISMTEEEVADAIKTKSESIGANPKFPDKDLRLFWSPRDNAFFAAAIGLDGVVVTIMPSAWIGRVTISPAAMARLSRVGNSPGQPTESTKPSKYIFTCYFRTMPSNKMRVKHMKISIADYPDHISDLKRFEQNVALHDKLKEFIRTHLQKDEYVLSICVKIGNNGTETILHIEL